MRIDSPDGSWRVDMRGENELTGADRKALEAVDDKVTGLDKGVWFSDDGSEFQMSADGTSLIPRPARRMVSRETIALARDTMLARLITGWTWEDKLPMPYHAGYLDSDELPIDAVEKIQEALEDAMDRLRSGGPREAGDYGDLYEYLAGKLSAPPAGLSPDDCRTCIWIARYGRLTLAEISGEGIPLGVFLWLDAVQATLDAIEARNRPTFSL